MSETPSGRMSVRARVRAWAFTTLWLVGVFAAAGTLDWVRGWIYVALYAAGMSALARLAFGRALRKAPAARPPALPT